MTDNKKKAQNGRNNKNGKNGNINAKAVVIAAIVIVAVVAALIVFLVVYRGKKGGEAPAVRSDPRGEVQDINTAESLGYISNPDVGFYRPAFVRLTPDGGSASTPVYNDISLYHLRVDISAFSGEVNGSGDMDITPAAIAKLNDVFDFYEERERSVIVRFAYDPGYNGAANKEPALEQMLAHIDSLAPVLNSHSDMLTAVEVGMVGPWGEMHTSAAANKTTINALIDRFMKKVEGAPVLVRTPRMIYDYLGITISDIEGYTVPSSAARLGMFNDGYLGSESDLGTYTDRAKETDFLSGITSRLPYGGEVTVPSSSLHDIDKCVPEMFKLHLSYLNYEWNNDIVQNKWKNSTYTAACGSDSAYYGKSAYEYIRNRMGYRLLVSKSVFNAADGVLTIYLDIDNVGFGNLNRTKNVSVLFVDEAGGVHAVAAGEYSGGDLTASVALPDAGSYKVYLMLHSGAATSPTYALAFANADMFNAELKANLIGSLTVK